MEMPRAFFAGCSGFSTFTGGEVVALPGNTATEGEAYGVPNSEVSLLRTDIDLITSALKTCRCTLSCM